MSKLSEEALRQAMVEADIDPALAESIISSATSIDKKSKSTSTSGDGKKRTRKQFVVVINDPDGKVPDNLSCWVLQKTEYYDEALGKITEYGDLDLGERITALTNTMKTNARVLKRIGSVKSMADVFEFSTKAIAEDQGIIVKTKEPVSLIRINGKEILNNKPSK